MPPKVSCVCVLSVGNAVERDSLLGHKGRLRQSVRQREAGNFELNLEHCSGSTLPNELLAARVNPDETKNWERKLFYLLTSALMGDPNEISRLIRNGRATL